MDFSGKNILITGINGFVGSASAEYFLEQGAHVVGLVKDRNKKSRLEILNRCSIIYGDIRDIDVIRYILSKYEIEYVLHLAAQPIVRICNNDPYTAYMTNIVGTLNVLEAIRQLNGKVSKAVVMTSVVGETPIMVKQGDDISRVNIEDLWNSMTDGGRFVDDSHISLDEKNISILNIEGHNAVFSEIDMVSRYKTDKDIYKVNYTGGEIEITEDHSLFVFDEDGNISEKRGGEIEAGDLLVSFDKGTIIESNYLDCTLGSLLSEESKKVLSDKTPRLKYNNLDDININDKYVLEFLGAYLAEGSSGCITSVGDGVNPYRVSLCFNNYNEDYLKEIFISFSDTYDYKFNVVEDESRTTFTISSLELALLVNDLFGHGARNKRLRGTWAWKLSTEQVKRLMLGYTGDAYKKHSKGLLRFTTASRELAVDVAWLYRLHGFSATLSHISEEYLAGRPKPQIDGREINTGDFWFITLPKIDNFLSDPQETSKFQREPFSRCLPSAFVKKILSDNDIAATRGLLGKRGVSKKRLSKANDEIATLFEKNSLSYCIVNDVEYCGKCDSFVYDVSCKHSEYPSFIAGLVPVLCHNSDKAYGSHAKLPYVEESELVVADSYCTSKACQDMVARSYAKTYGLPVSVVRAGNLYGPGDMNTSRLIPRSILRMFSGKSPVLYSGVMNFVREFIYIDNIVSAYSTLLEKGEPGEAYNVGGTPPQKIIDVISMIRDKINPDMEIEIIEKDFYEIEKQYLDASKLVSLGWSPQVDLNTGLDLSIAWYRDYLLNGGVSCD